MYEKLRNEFEKLQQLYSESLDKMSALQIELEIQNITCANCKARIEKRDQIGIGNASADLFKELQSIKEKLIQKSQLLEKAKILLTRAAAKERNFREQVTASAEAMLFYMFMMFLIYRLFIGNVDARNCKMCQSSMRLVNSLLIIIASYFSI